MMTIMEMVRMMESKRGEKEERVRWSEKKKRERRMSEKKRGKNE